MKESALNVRDVSDTYNTPLSNPAIVLFNGDGTPNSPSHLNFTTWYHPDICHYLLQMSLNQAQYLRVIFNDSGYDNNTGTFKNQLQTLIVLGNKLDKPAIFLSKEPGANNHFVLGLVRKNNLLLINPLGITLHADAYKTLAELQQEDTLSNLWLSSTALQKREYEEEGLVSCGPISLELAMHILQHFTLTKLHEFWNSLETNELIVHGVSSLRYFGISINTLLSESLLELSAHTNDETAYKKRITKIRQQHGEQLANLALLCAKKANKTVETYLENLKKSAPAQVVYNALLTQHSSVVTIDNLSEYQSLVKELEESAKSEQPELEKTDSIININGNSNTNKTSITAPVTIVPNKYEKQTVLSQSSDTSNSQFIPSSSKVEPTLALLSNPQFSVSNVTQPTFNVYCNNITLYLEIIKNNRANFALYTEAAWDQSFCEKIDLFERLNGEVNRLFPLPNSPCTVVKPFEQIIFEKLLNNMLWLLEDINNKIIKSTLDIYFPNIIFSLEVIRANIKSMFKALFPHKLFMDPQVKKPLTLSKQDIKKELHKAINEVYQRTSNVPRSYKDEFKKSIDEILSNQTYKLVLKIKDITRDRINVLAQALKHNNRVIELDLSDNNIDDECLMILLNGLKSLSALTCLKLARNNISNLGLKEIIVLLKENRLIITELDLSKNKISDKGIKSLAEVLRKTRTLIKVNLEYNLITNNSEIDLIGAFHESSLIILTLKNKSLDPDKWGWDKTKKSRQLQLQNIQSAKLESMEQAIRTYLEANQGLLVRVNEQQDSLLHVAIRLCAFNLVTELLMRMAENNFESHRLKNIEGKTPFDVATEILKKNELISDCQKLDDVKRDKRRIFIHVAAYYFVELIQSKDNASAKKLLHSIDSKYHENLFNVFYRKRTALYYAAINSCFKILPYLIAKSPDTEQGSALNLALDWAIEDQQETGIRILLQYGANPNKVAEWQCNSMFLTQQLFNAIENNKVSDARNKIEKTARLQVFNSYYLKDPYLVWIQDSRYSNLIVMGSAGYPCYYAPSHFENSFLVWTPDQLYLSLIASGSLGCPCYYSPLHFAVFKGLKNLVSCLIEHGADVNCQDSNSKSPLQWALYYNQVEIAKILIAQGATITEIPSPKFSLPINQLLFDMQLIQAAREDDFPAVKKLIHARADPYAKKELTTTNGFMAISWAVHNSNEIMLLFLLQEMDTLGKLQQCKKDLITITINTRNPIMLKHLLNLANHSDDFKGFKEDNSTDSSKSHDDLDLVPKNNGSIYLEDLTEDENLKKILKGQRMITLVNEGNSGALNQFEGLETLLDHVDCSNDLGNTALHLAVTYSDENHIKCMHILHEHIKKNKAVLNKKNASGATPLHLAVEAGNTEVVRELLKADADIEIENNQRKSPLELHTTEEIKQLIRIKKLILLASRNDKVGIQMLLSLGISATAIDTTSPNQISALHIASEKGNIEALQVLAEYSNDIDVSDTKGWTALHHAAKSNQTQSVQWLISCGAKIFAETKNKEELYELASSDPVKTIIRIAQLMEWVSDKNTFKIKAITDLGKFVDILYQGKMLLHLAAEKGYDEGISILIEKGASLDSLDRSGNTPLHYAAKYDKEKAVQTLLAKGANPEKINNYNQTPDQITSTFEIKKLISSQQLILSIQRGDYSGVKQALRKGADYNAEDATSPGSKATTMHYAVVSKNQSIIKTLHGHGAKIDAKDKLDLTPLGLAVALEKAEPTSGKEKNTLPSLLIKLGAQSNEQANAENKTQAQAIRSLYAENKNTFFQPKSKSENRQSNIQVIDLPSSKRNGL